MSAGCEQLKESWTCCCAVLTMRSEPQLFRGSISSHSQYLLWCIWPRCGLTFWVALIGCSTCTEAWDCDSAVKTFFLALFTLHLVPWEVSANMCKLFLPYKNLINHLYLLIFTCRFSCTINMLRYQSLLLHYRRTCCASRSVTSSCFMAPFYM